MEHGPRLRGPGVLRQRGRRVDRDVDRGGSDKFDFRTDGGLDKKSQTAYVSAQVGIAPLELRLSAFEYDESGTGTYTGEFFDQTFTGDVATDFSIGTYKGTLGLDLLNLERFRVGIIAGAAVFDIDLEMRETGGGLTVESGQETFPVPIVGARGDLKLLRNLRVGAEVTIFPLDEVEDLDVSYTDLEAGIHFEPLPYLEIFGLYRYIDLEVDGEIENVDTVVDILFEGPVVGVAVTF